jgi:threonine dehydratase
MALEILDQVPDVDVIVVPVGGCGLIAGISLAVKTLKSHVKVCTYLPLHAHIYVF